VRLNTLSYNEIEFSFNGHHDDSESRLASRKRKYEYLHPRPPRIGSTSHRLRTGVRTPRVPPARTYARATRCLISAPAPARSRPTWLTWLAESRHGNRQKELDLRARPSKPGASPVSTSACRRARPHFPDGSFDVVHAHQVLRHVCRPVQALREMARSPARAAWSQRATATTRLHLVAAAPGLDEWLAAVPHCRTRPTAASPTPAAGCCRGPRRLTSPTSRPRRHLVLRRTPPTATTGAHVVRRDHGIRAGPPAGQRRLRDTHDLPPYQCAWSPGQANRWWAESGRSAGGIEDLRERGHPLRLPRRARRH